MHFCHFDVRDWFNTMIQNVQNHTAQSQEVAWDLEINDLSLTVL